MSELIKLLDSSVDDVKAGLADLSHDDLLKLKAAETDGKTRKGVLDAIEAALAAAADAAAGGRVEMTSENLSGAAPALAADLDQSGLADLPPATEVDTSGAPQQIVPDVDMTHPAVDNDPRAGTTDTMNRIDFNDPAKSGVDAVTDALTKRGDA